MYIYGSSKFLEEVGKRNFIELEIYVLAALLETLLLGLELEVKLLDAVCELFIMDFELETRNLGNVQQTLVHLTIKLLFKG